MIDQYKCQLLQSYMDKCTSQYDKEQLNEIIDELLYRLPQSRIYYNNTCPRCQEKLPVRSNFCQNCGQALE